ncbi:estradiol 17-beta-dehydrogenase 12 [Clonorchis sinensis]|uniref:Estradiol 17-beta-dehydrogenase 12 n=1 Tax=Clonorchis sinensis TaxID=79923 RepID=G7Y5V0_CLOSI|nr:estradiol 17-beta-dehydrogenase 12 [Clonorchis sinensis]
MFVYVFLIALLGLLFYVVIPVIFIILEYTIGPKLFGKRKQLRKAGQWAVITGASDGIGKAFAQELASDGLDVMLISRSAGKLEALATELRKTYGVSVKYIAVDFTQENIYDDIRKEVDALSSIACLVNNVGMVNVSPMEFCFEEGMCVDKIHDYIACNCLSMAAMTHIVLPRLVAQKSGAALINLASFTSIQPLPYISLYTGTKAFVRQLSESLKPEVRGCNVLVHTIYPMYVATSMVGRRRGFWVISPTQCARSSLDMLGVNSFCTGHLIHELQTYYFSFLPQSSFNHSMEQKLKRARQRALKTE